MMEVTVMMMIVDIIRPLPQPQVHMDREDADEGITQPVDDVEPVHQDMHQLERDTRQLLADEDVPLQEEVALEERVPAAQPPVQSEDRSECEPQHQRPRIFTYDQLGHPSCCGSGHLDDL